MVTIKHSSTYMTACDEGSYESTMTYPSDIRKDYSIGHVVGKGASATVRSGRSRATGERVAIKVISKKRLSEED